MRDFGEKRTASAMRTTVITKTECNGMIRFARPNCDDGDKMTRTAGALIPNVYGGTAWRSQNRFVPPSMQLKDNDV
jgi:hypothetical protein